MPVPVVPAPGVKVPVPGVPPIAPPVVGVIVPTALYKEGNAVNILVTLIQVYAECSAIPMTIIWMMD
jgi:hypothetical protein